MVLGPAVLLAVSMADRKVTTPGGGARMSARLLTLMIAGTIRSSSCSSHRRGRLLRLRERRPAMPVLGRRRAMRVSLRISMMRLLELGEPISHQFRVDRFGKHQWDTEARRVDEETDP